jgi:hypothetical protein
VANKYVDAVLNINKGAEGNGLFTWPLENMDRLKRVFGWIKPVRHLGFKLAVLYAGTIPKNDEQYCRKRNIRADSIMLNENMANGYESVKMANIVEEIMSPSGNSRIAPVTTGTME